LFGAAIEVINIATPIKEVIKLIFNVLRVSTDAIFHSPKKTDNKVPCAVVTIMSIGQPIDAAILSGKRVDAQTP
jgi:hypothetical protein